MPQKCVGPDEPNFECHGGERHPLEVGDSSPPLVPPRIAVRFGILGVGPLGRQVGALEGDASFLRIVLGLARGGGLLRLLGLFVRVEPGEKIKRLSRTDCAQEAESVI